MPYKQSNPIANERLMAFSMRSSTTGLPQAGLTFATTDLQVMKAGGSYANATNIGTVSDKGGGDYVLTLTAAEIDTVGVIAMKVNKAGSTPYTQTEQIAPALMGTAVTGTLTAIAFTVDLATGTASQLINALLVWRSGGLKNQYQRIASDSSGSPKLVTLAVTCTAAPANGDVFEILIS